LREPNRRWRGRDSGLSGGGAAAESQLEQRFDADLSAADLRSWLEQMSSERITSARFTTRQTLNSN